MGSPFATVLKQQLTLCSVEEHDLSHRKTNIPSDGLVQANSKLQSLLDLKATLCQQLLDHETSIQMADAERKLLLNQERAHILRLPHDLLIEVILLLNALSRYRKATAPPILVSHVCRVWREVALQTPLLWTDIRLLGGSPISQTTDKAHESLRSKAKAYFRRSKPCLFDLRLTVSGHNDTRTSLKLLLRNRSRCRSLYISQVHDYSFFSSLLMAVLQSSLTDQQFPVLERFTICVEASDHAEYDERQFQVIQPSIFSLGSPCLRHVELMGVSGSLQPPLSQVTTLHVDGTVMAPITYSQYRSLLDGLPNIEHLSMLRFTVVRDGSNPVPWRTVLATQVQPVSLPHLRSLRLCGGFLDDYQIRYHLLMLPIAQIESLALQSVAWLEGLAFPKVHMLTYRDPADAMPNPSRLLQCFPSLKQLNLCGLQFAALCLDNTTRQPNSSATNLEELAITEVAPKDAPSLCRSLNRLCDNEDTRLRVLHLDRKSRISLRLGFSAKSEEKLSLRRIEYLPSWPEGMGMGSAGDVFWWDTTE